MAFRNEASYLANALTHLAENDIRFVLIDNGSDDGSRAIAERAEFKPYRKQLVDLPYEGQFNLTRLLALQHELAAQTNAEWLLGCAPDEIMHSDRDGETLRAAISRLADQGANAINFDEFVFLPIEADYAPQAGSIQPMRHYYFFEPHTPRLMRAYQKRAGLSLLASGGHTLKGAEVLLAGEHLALRHYIFRDQDHAYAKYAERRFAAADLARGWHHNRARQDPRRFAFPLCGMLERMTDPGARLLSKHRPWMRHYWEAESDAISAARKS